MNGLTESEKLNSYYFQTQQLIPALNSQFGEPKDGCLSPGKTCILL